MDINADLEGTYRVHRYSRETGEHLGTERASNAVQAGGRDLILNVGTGASADAADNANAAIEVLNSSPSQVFTAGSADSGYPSQNVSNQSVTWQWSDISTNTYTVDTVRFRQGSTTGTIVSEATPSFGSKPSSENWIYEYTLSISSSDADIQGSGLHEWLEAFGGFIADAYNPLWLRIQDSGGGQIGNLQEDSAPSLSGGTLSWTFTSPSGSHESATWSEFSFGKDPAPPDLAEVLHNSTQFLPDKQNAEWTVNYDFTLNT